MTLKVRKLTMVLTKKQKWDITKIGISITLIVVAAVVVIFFDAWAGAIAEEKDKVHNGSLVAHSVVFKEVNGSVTDLEKSMIKIATVQEEQTKTFNSQMDRFDTVLTRFETRLDSM